MYTLYILQCSDKTLYTGIAVNVVQRVEAHNHSKSGAKYTRSRRPVKLVYTKRFRTRSRGLQEEYRIKQLSKKEKLALIQKKTIALNAILLYVKSPRVSAVFYKKLGFRIGKPIGAMTHATLGTIAFTLLDQKRATFQQDTPRTKGAGVFFYFRVASVDRFYRSLVQKGLRPSGAPRDWPWGNREFAIKDPDGYRVVFYQPLS